MVASSMTPLDICDGLYSKQYFKNQTFEDQILNGGHEDDSAAPEALCCDNGATSSLSSSFLNCTEITERAVAIQTAQGGTVMMTTHV